MTAVQQTSPGRGRANEWLRRALDLRDGDTPFPWQEELLSRFAAGTVERSLDIPTGLGKTGVMAIWLVARAQGAALPRRLVYVVDRRAVVDQATRVAEGLRACVERDPELKQALGLGEQGLPISTLRGQHIDNKEWLDDPASPAIIVGTVDMIGSRFLFEGYGTTRKMRPYHAGLLGADTLVVLDEAHLVPPFEKLFESVTNGVGTFGPRDKELRGIVPPFRLLSLSATGRTSMAESFGLQDADLMHPVVKRRLEAPKRLTLRPLADEASLEDALAEHAWNVADSGRRPVRCIVFCDKRKVAADTQEAIRKRAKSADVQVETELFVGGRRVFEREAAAKRLADLGFITGANVGRMTAAFVFATSAGEVGVDLDADHMVSDLVAWERMVQRLGRVNRRGDGDAEVIVVVEQPKPKKAVKEALAKTPGERSEKESQAIEAHETSLATVQTQRKPFDHLPPRADGGVDASPGALRELKSRSQADAELQKILDRATTPAPLRPALSRALVDAWSMTSLKQHTGRPEVGPWLRGWSTDDPPQTTIVWRTFLPARADGWAVAEKEIESFFEAAPPHASEVLETETFRVVQWLAARWTALLAAENTPTIAGQHSASDIAPIRRRDVAGVILTAVGDLRGILRLEDLAPHEERRKGDLERALSGATLVVDARIAGLQDGLLEHTATRPPRTVDDGAPWMSTASSATGKAAVTSSPPVIRFRVRRAEPGHPLAIDAEWRDRFRLATKLSADGEPTQWLIVEKWRYDAATEEDRSAGRPQLLDEHHAWTEDRAHELARRLALPDVYVDMLATSARLHDEGKRAARWQRAFHGKRDGVYAKTRGPLSTALLDGYRHEFGSLPFAASDVRLRDLPEELRDLALHLIAAHHGFARPVISTSGCEDAPPSALDGRAREVALRFARLQKRWGPWALAWWEALLRAADQQASRDNDAADSAGADRSA